MVSSVGTVNEVSKLSGVSIRTLHYYDKIGLLRTTQTTDSGYRLYDDTAFDTTKLDEYAKQAKCMPVAEV